MLTYILNTDYILLFTYKSGGKECVPKSRIGAVLKNGRIWYDFFVKYKLRWVGNEMNLKKTAVFLAVIMLAAPNAQAIESINEEPVEGQKCQKCIV